MLYELTTLSCPLLGVAEAAAGAEAWLRDGEALGTPLGCWRTEIGALGRVLVLRGFEQPHDMTVERHRALMSGNPFNAARVATALEMDSYAPFSFLPPPRVGDRGGIYEFRTYRLKPGGLPPTLAAWEAAVGPAEAYTSHMVINMYALDGPPCITHVWGFGSLEERSALRSQAMADGLWPPKGGPAQILDATSVIALPQQGSPLS